VVGNLRLDEFAGNVVVKDIEFSSLLSDLGPCEVGRLKDLNYGRD